MDIEQVKKIVKNELPAILQQDEVMQEIVLDKEREHFADKEDTKSRFDVLIEEMRRDREEQSRKWAEQKKESDKKWAEQKKESDKKWAEQKKESDKKWAEQRKESDTKWEGLKEAQRKRDEKWAEESKRHWEKQEKTDQRLDRLVANVEKLSDRHDATTRRLERSIERLGHSIGALGSRWGLRSEASFRNALRGILEEDFAVEVLNIIEDDKEGEVFGKSAQIELDVLIKNGLLIIIEIKSSMSRSDMFTFYKKVNFYRKKHQKNVSQMIVISPMVDERARLVAPELGITIYSHAADVKL